MSFARVARGGEAGQQRVGGVAPHVHDARTVREADDPRPDRVGRERGRRGEQVLGGVRRGGAPARPGRERAAGDDVVPDGDLCAGARVHLVDAPRVEARAVGAQRHGEQLSRLGGGEQVEPGTLVGRGRGERHGPRQPRARGSRVRPG